MVHRLKKRVLVVGGYGAVGSEVCRHLARDERIEVVVAGRSDEKAGALASEIGATALVMDAHAPGDALDGAAAVINCFVDLGLPSMALAENALVRGLLYVDVAGIPAAHVDGILTLHDRAVSTGATLVTALGCNPGIPGLLALDNHGRFERIDEVDFYFTLGSKLTGLSVLSLQGVGQLMREKPQVWTAGAWCSPRTKTRKRKVGPPFDKDVYFGAAYVPRDLVRVPEVIGAGKVAFWSGIESTFQGMVFLAGVQLGGADKPARAGRMLRWLRAVGGRNAHDEAILEMVAKGARDGRPATRHVSLACTEEYLTAISPAVVVQQWLDAEFTGPGAFLPPDIVPARSFVGRLGRAQTHLQEIWS